MNPPPAFVSTNVQLTLPPAVRVNVAVAVAILPVPAVQLTPLSTKSAGTFSVIVNVPGVTALNVTLPLPATVVPVVLMPNVASRPLLPPALVVNVKPPFPPLVCFVTVTVPLRGLVKPQPTLPPAVTVKVAAPLALPPGPQLIAVWVKSGLPALSLTV